MYRANQKGITWRTLRPLMLTSFYINIDKCLSSQDIILSIPLLLSILLLPSLSLSLSRLLVAHPPTLKSMTPSVLVQLCFPHLPAQTGYQQLLYGSKMSRRVTRWGTSTTEAAGGTNTQRMCECVYSLRDYEELHLCVCVYKCVLSSG